MDYTAQQALEQAFPKSQILAEQYTKVIETDIAEAASQGVTQIIESNVPGNMLIGLVSQLMECGFQVDYDETEGIETGVVTYPAYAVTIDWSGLSNDETEDEDES